MATPLLAPAAPEQAPAPAPAPLGFEVRLAAVDAAMSVRLQEAGLAVDVNTAHLPNVDFDLGDIVRLPASLPGPPEPEHASPVAAMLQRARRLLDERGWCTGCSRDEQGALCLVGAIQKAARGDRRLEMEGLNLLLEQIRRDLDPNVDTIPSWNDRQPSARMPLRILDHTTNTAANRDI